MKFQVSHTSAVIYICGATIDIVRCPGRTSDNRERFAYAIVLPDFAGEFHADDLRSGVGGCSFREAAQSLLSFLSACAESRGLRYSAGHGENADLFPDAVGEWACAYSDEIAMAREEIANA